MDQDRQSRSPEEARSISDERLQQLIAGGPDALAPKDWNVLLDEWLRRGKPSDRPVRLGNVTLGTYEEPDAAVAAYQEVPWFRRSGVNSVLLLVGLVFPPAMACVCGTLITGDIYYKELGADGSLKRWSRANRVVALLAFGFQVLVVVSLLVAR